MSYNGPTDNEHVPGLKVEGALFGTYVHSAFVKNGTTGPAQVTGTGDGTFYYDNTVGIVVIGNVAVDIAAAADTLLETAGDILASGQSKVYRIVAWRHPESGAIAKKVIGGTPATTGTQEAPTDDEVVAALYKDALWVELGRTTINRTADTTATQTATSNIHRPLGTANVTRA